MSWPRAPVARLGAALLLTGRLRFPTPFRWFCARPKWPRPPVVLALGLVQSGLAPCRRPAAGGRGPSAGGLFLCTFALTPPLLPFAGDAAFRSAPCPRVGSRCVFSLRLAAASGAGLHVSFVGARREPARAGVSNLAPRPSLFFDGSASGISPSAHQTPATTLVQLSEPRPPPPVETQN